MVRTKDALLQDLSTADLKRLLAAREQIDVLEKEKAGLVAALAKIDRELEKLVNAAIAATGGGAGGTTSRKKSSKKKTAKKKTAKKKTTKKKTTKKKTRKKATKKKPAKKKTTKKKATKKKTGKKKTVAKKVSRKKAAKKKASGKGVRKKSSGAKTGGKRATLEEVIVAVLEKAGGPMAYKDLFARIVDGKLFKTTSSNFDNVMRRTLSTSDKVKRVGRGIYGLA